MNTPYKVLKTLRISKSYFVRQSSLSHTLYNNTSCSENQEVWKKAVNKAETIVGYPNSFLSLRWLLNDELANVAFYIRKLIGTNHALLKTAKNLFIGEGNFSWGLVILLVSKAAGVNSGFSDIERDHIAGILHSQRVLAEITEMIRTSNLMHKSVFNITSETEFAADMNYGNTIALLSGDYLLSTSFRELSRLQNHDLNELISSALRDLAESDFIGTRDGQNNPLPSKPVSTPDTAVNLNTLYSLPYKIENVLGNARPEWTLRSILGGAALLGKSCQGSLLLSKHSEDLQKLAYLFGRNLALAWQAALECEQIVDPEIEQFSLVSAPVVLHLEHDPSFYSVFENVKDINSDINYQEVKNVILNGPALEETLLLKKDFSKECLDILDNFRASEAKDALINIIKLL